MEHFDPLMWVIENPATGLLKTRPFMERLPWVDVTYCMYGTPYRKTTLKRFQVLQTTFKDKGHMAFKGHLAI